MPRIITLAEQVHSLREVVDQLKNAMDLLKNDMGRLLEMLENIKHQVEMQALRDRYARIFDGIDIE